jgi:superfamily II DNA or RNA helicase
MKPHPHQTLAIERARAAVRRGLRRLLIVAPTGSGKTVLIALMARGHLDARDTNRVLVLVHRRELAQQTVSKLRAIGVADVDVLQAGAEVKTGARIVVASVQTITARGERPPATMVLWDEAHHVLAATFRDVYAAYPDAIHCGYTATPTRADGKGLGSVFEEMIVAASVRELTALGLLTPSEVLCLGEPTRDLAIDPVAAYVEYTPGRPAVVFASSVEHARALVPQFSAAGYRAACVDGEMPSAQRDVVLTRFAVGGLDVITNCFVLTEGFDAPRAEVCILARSPGCVGTFLQMVGRVLRVTSGKKIATVLDLRGSSLEHGLPDEDRTWNLHGAACTRSETFTALQRCTTCLAVFRPASKCPRCGATRDALVRLPRSLNRAEKLERLNDVPIAERDRRYVERLMRIATTRMRMPPHRAQQWAHRQFTNRFGREPMNVRAA